MRLRSPLHGIRAGVRKALLISALSLIACLPLGSFASESATVQSLKHSSERVADSAQVYRLALAQLLDELELNRLQRQSLDPVLQSGLNQMRDSLGQLTDSQLALLQSGHVALERIVQAADRLRTQREQDQSAQTTASASATRDAVQSTTASTKAGIDPIEFPEPDPISACSNTTPARAYNELIAFSTLEEVLAGAKWLCEQLEVGENGAAACTSIGVAAVVTGGSFEFDEFCLSNMRSANGSALLQTQRNIGSYLNNLVDATTTSRASQDSLDALQLDITSANQQLLQLHNVLSQAFSRYEDDLGLAVSTISTLVQRNDGLLTQIRDLQQRLRATQVDVEDTQLRLADLQQDHEEIRTDTQSLIAQLNRLDQSLSSYEAELSQRITQAQRDDIARVLSNPNLTVMRYLLPQSRSGALEEVREVLIRAILSAEALGIKTTSARNLLTQADQAYAQQSYVNAYNLFAQSYQSLNSTMRSPTLTEPRSP